MRNPIKRANKKRRRRERRRERIAVACLNGPLLIGLLFPSVQVKDAVDLAIQLADALIATLDGPAREDVLAGGIMAGQDLQEHFRKEAEANSP